MTKNQKMLLGVGVLGVAGYLIWKQNQKPAASTTTASFSGFRNALGTNLAPKAKCGCNKSSEPVPGMSYGGRPVYECCGNGVFAFAPGPVVAECLATGCPKTTTTGTGTTVLTQGF